jgi:TonB family protein
MRGRVSIKGMPVDLRVLCKRQIAKRKGRYFQLPLSLDSRGKVIVGDTTFLFQFVVPPLLMPRPQLPAAVRAGWVKRIDWVFSSIVMISFLFQFGFIIWVENYDWPKETGWEAVPDRFAKLLIAKPPKEKKDKSGLDKLGEGEVELEEGEVAKGKEVRKGKGKRVKGKKGPVDPEAAARAAAERRARLRAALAGTGMIKIIGSIGGKGALSDMLKGGDVFRDMDEALSQVSGVGVARGGEGGGALRRRMGGGGAGGATGRVIGIEDLKARGGNQEVSSGSFVERKIKGNVRAEKGEEIGGTGTADPASVARRVRNRIRAITYCYERRLKAIPTLEGKITIRFKIGTAGTVISASVDEDTIGDSQLASCVVGAIRRIRFDPPEGGFVEFMYPFIFKPGG